MKWNEIVPVLTSIGVIILVAVLQRQSRAVAAVTATMPVNVVLALWIVYAAADGEQQVVAQFVQGMVVGIIPTVAFLLAAWLAARAGLKIVPIIAISYATWATMLALVLLLRRVIDGRIGG